MTKQQSDSSKYVSTLDAIALILFAVTAVVTYIGAASTIVSAHISDSNFAFAAGWNHEAMVIGGVVGMVVSAGLAFASYLGKKSLSNQ